MNLYYKGYTDAAKKYQKSESYKIYRRSYEARYRQEHLIMVNYLSWKTMQRKYGKKVTEQKEMNYLLKRFLND